MADILAAPPHRPRTVVTRGISLPVGLQAGLDALTRESGHFNRSRIIQDLLERALVNRYGPDWPAVVAAREPGAPGGAAS